MHRESNQIEVIFPYRKFHCVDNRTNQLFLFHKTSWWWRWESLNEIFYLFWQLELKSFLQSGIFNLRPRECSSTKFYQFHGQFAFPKCHHFDGGSRQLQDRIGMAILLVVFVWVTNLTLIVTFGIKLNAYIKKKNIFIVRVET